MNYNVYFVSPRYTGMGRIDGNAVVAAESAEEAMKFDSGYWAIITEKDKLEGVTCDHKGILEDNIDYRGWFKCVIFWKQIFMNQRAKC